MCIQFIGNTSKSILVFFFFFFFSYCFFFKKKITTLDILCQVLWSPLLVRISFVLPPKKKKKKNYDQLSFFIVEGACSPARYEPELSLNLEICEMINKKQGSA